MRTLLLAMRLRANSWSGKLACPRQRNTQRTSRRRSRKAREEEAAEEEAEEEEAKEEEEEESL